MLRELSATLIGRSRKRHEAIEWALARITAPPPADGRIAAWDSVFETLREVKPDFTHNDKTGMQAACDAIRELAAEAKAPPAAVTESGAALGCASAEMQADMQAEIPRT